MIEASHTKGNSLSDEEIKEEVNTIMFEVRNLSGAYLLSLTFRYEPTWLYYVDCIVHVSSLV